MFFFLWKDQKEKSRGRPVRMIPTDAWCRFAEHDNSDLSVFCDS